MAISPNLAQALSQFGTQVANIQAQVDRLEKNQRQNSLPYSSIDNGFITVTDDTGTVRQVIGIQADGTATTVDMNGPQPGALDDPTVTPTINGLTVAWDGEFAGSTVYPSDYMMTQIHVSTTASFTPSASTLAGVLHTAGSYAILNLTPGTTYYVVLAALSTSGVLGELSNYITGVPLVNSPTISPGSITTTDIAPGAVTTPILAANAVTAANMAANSVVAGTVAAGAIDGLTITGNVINGALVNAGTLTFSDAAGGGVFGYTNGVLTVALAGSPGTDTSGYSFPAGFSMGAPGAGQILLSQDTAGAYLAQPTNDPNEGIAAQLNSEIINQGAVNQQLAYFLASPSNNASTDKNQWYISMTSDSSDNTIPAQFLIEDTFGVPYISMTNQSASGLSPMMLIGGEFGGQYPVTVNMNGAILTYGGTAGLTITQTWNTAGTHNWTAPAGLTTLSKVEVWGGGGGGGGGSAPGSSGNGGAGGGGGGYRVATNVAVTGGNVYTLTVGSGGFGGISGTPTGAPGGNAGAGTLSSFPGDSVTTTAGGGGGGTGGHNGHTGGAGGTGSATGGTGGNAPFDGTSTGGAGGGGAGGPSGGGVGGGGVSGRNPGAGGSGNRGGTSGGDGAGGGWGSTSNNGSKGAAGSAPGGGGSGGGGGTDAHTYGGGAGAVGWVKITYTQPGTTAILASMANSAGTDSGGNTYPTGFMGQIAAVQPGSSPSVPETWHNLGLASGYAATGTPMNSGGVLYAQYKKLPDGSLRLRGSIKVTAGPGGSANAAILGTTLSAAYSPPSGQQRYFPVAWQQQSINTGSNDQGGIGVLTSGGQIFVYGGASVGNYLFFEATIDLS